MTKSAAELLESHRQLTLGRLKALTEELVTIVSSRETDNGDDEHDPEGSTVAFERQRVAALQAQALADLAELERAVERLANDQYGCCLSCQRPIGDERLRALPTTQFCVTCARGQNRENLHRTFT